MLHVSSHRRAALPLLLALPFLASIGRRLPADVEEDVGVATEKGVEFLLKEIEAKQMETGEHDDKKMGKIALETYALIVAGVGVEHPIIQRNFETLSHMALDQTYSIACYLFALDAAISQLQADAAMAKPSQKMVDDANVGAQYRPRLEAGVNAMVRIRQKTGGWNYTAGGNRFDNSNSQFAVLGLGVGMKRRVPIPNDVWIEIAQHFLHTQTKDGPEVQERLLFNPEDEKGEGKKERINIVDITPDGKAAGKKKEEKKGSPTKVQKAPVTGGEKMQYFARGWGYQASGETWNMTCGGLSSMILADMALRGKAPADIQAQIAKSVRDGYGWIMRNWNPRGGGGWQYYGIYSLEKVGDLGEVKKFGINPASPNDTGHEWYKEVRDICLAEQRQDGSWPGGNKVQTRWNTAFALLVLNRATSLITQGRSNVRLVGTGAGGAREKGTADDKNWIYIQEFDREFHVPTILRQVRMRPSPKLLNILELALKNYTTNKPQDAGYLVWNLAQARDAAAARKNAKNLQSFLDDQLLKIAGVKYETADQYKAWYKRFVDFDNIGKSMKDPENFLPKIYPKTSKSVPLKRKLIWAVGRCRSKACARYLVGDLGNDDQDVRIEAYSTLALIARDVCPDPIPEFDAKAAPTVRDPQVVAINSWLAKGTGEKPPAKAPEGEKAADKPAEKTAEKTADAK